MHKIPVTIITGFLGSGKTTLIRHLLRNNEGRRIAVLVNEFGEVGIDGDLLKTCQICDDVTEENVSNSDANKTENSELNSTILELTNGCLCCTVQEEFLPTMQELLKRRDRIDSIVIETSGLALPKPLVQAFRWPEIRTGATVDGVITVVDGAALAEGQLVGDIDALNSQRQADPNLDHETPIEELFEDQLACADLVLLSKSDCISEENLPKVQTWLRENLPDRVKVVSCDRGQMSIDVLLGFNAAVEDNLDSRPSHHDHEEEHEHDDNINAVQIKAAQEFAPKALISQLQELLETQEIYRIKGFVAVPGKAMRLVLQGVGRRFDYFYDRPWNPDEPRETQLVFIGENLDRSAIETALLSPTLV
ncbi:cobalamin biosynthesis protein CobW [Baaleninema simplex]|uniref:cobalamin biosynthesis protein CobW n=1 Tax=Baaleninema simplex TaxID=2862350 RepID=UPI0003477AF0|nr:cobalamin biosynthesis protein CobW [Baaleninema simplex]